MIKKLFFILGILCITISLFAQDLSFAPEIQDIIQRGKLVVALHSREQAPFFFTNKAGQFDGLDVRLARGIADTLGVKLEFNRDAQSFNNLVEIVARGDADMVISKLSLTLKRAQLVQYSEPYITFRQALIVNRLRLAEIVPEDRLASFVRSFRGRLGVVANSSYANFARINFPDADVIEYPTWADVVEAVVSGGVLAAYRDELEVKKIIRSRPDASLRLKTIVLTDTRDDIAIAMRWNNPQLVYWVNRYLHTLNLDYDADALLDEYPEIFEN